MERTYVMIKPDAVRRRLVGEIINRIEKKGYEIVYLEMDVPTKEVLLEHYSHIKDKPFFPSILEFLTSGPVVKMVVKGEDAVSGIRKMLGETDPKKAAVGTIRGDLSNCTGRNVCHASDSVESAEKEISLWIKRPLPETGKMPDHSLIYE